MTFGTIFIFVSNFLVDEKLEVVRKLQDTDTKFSSLQQEYNSIHSLYNSVLQENSKLSVKVNFLKAMFFMNSHYVRNG